MTRDTKIVAALLAAVPSLILGAAALCSLAIANGASLQWRILFRLLCHGLPRRCFELFAVPMPICARCTGIYAGLLAGAALFPIAVLLHERVMRPIAIAAALPLAMDGLTQLLQFRESSNPLRMTTGVLAGLAFGLWVVSAIRRRQNVPSVSS